MNSPPGQLIELSDGITHYQLVGHSNDPIVVLIHGIAVPYTVWNNNTEDLLAGGFRLLRYDLFGRGYSDHPNTMYNQELFIRQLRELLVRLNIEKPINIAGMSLGALITVVFADLHPELIGKIVLIDPVEFEVDLPREASLVKAPILGEVIMKLIGKQVILRDLPKGIFNPDLVSDYMQLALPQFEIPGFKRAFLSTLREFAYQERSAVFHRVGELGLPALLIWGEEDQSVPISLSSKVRAAIPQIEFHPIPRAGHLPHYEKPQVVNPLLVEFLRN